MAKASKKQTPQPQNAQEIVVAALEAGQRITVWIDDWTGGTADGRDFDKPSPDGIEFRLTPAAEVEEWIRNELDYDGPAHRLMRERLLELVEEIRTSGCLTFEAFREYQRATEV